MYCTRQIKSNQNVTVLMFDKPQPSYNIVKRDKITASERPYMLNGNENT